MLEMYLYKKQQITKKQNLSFDQCLQPSASLKFILFLFWQNYHWNNSSQHSCSNTPIHPFYVENSFVNFFNGIHTNAYIFRFFDVFPNFPCTKTKLLVIKFVIHKLARDLQNDLRLRILENQKKSGKSKSLLELKTCAQSSCQNIFFLFNFSKNTMQLFP